MDKKPTTTETIKRPVVQENLMAEQGVESPEEVRQQIITKAQEEIDSFTKECANGIARVEERASAEGSSISTEDKDTLVNLEKEAGAAQVELMSEITSPSEKINIVEITKDHNFASSIIIKTKDAEGRITGYAIRKDNRGDWEGNKIRYMKDSSRGPVYQLHESDFEELRQQGILDAYENIPEMKERKIENPELLDKKEASKKFLAEERAKLAQELWIERKAQYEKLAALRSGVEKALVASENTEGLQGDSIYGEIANVQSSEANVLANHLQSLLGFSEQEAPYERENISQLIENGKGIARLKAKLQEHYEKADTLAKEKFESMRRTVEQTLLRNNAFIVHTFVSNEKLRHNENSNILKRATIEDDIDILLSLEPSISTSSVMPGIRQGLWDEGTGVVLGGGDVRGVVQSDNGTLTGGIKYRNGKESSSQEIDEKVSDKSERGYNELVVNNPKVFGFFQNINTDESGKMIGFSFDRRYERPEDKAAKKEKFMRFVNLAIQKGMPPLVMTPNRRIFEFKSINDDGIISVGSEITPKQVATGKAGLVDEKRREVGEKIISKNLFRYMKDQKEAKGIVGELAGQENAEELSREEYLAYAKDNQGRFYEFPKHLREDKEFMLEAAPFNPVLAYEQAGENLKRNIDFIKYIYSLEKKGNTGSIYSSMPDDLKKSELIASLAIENNDYEALDASLADSQLIWEKIVDKMTEREKPDKWFSRNIGEGQYMEPHLHMRSEKGSIDLCARFVANTNFIQKLNDTYPNYKFEASDYSRILVTKLA